MVKVKLWWFHIVSFLGRIRQIYTINILLIQILLIQHSGPRLSPRLSRDVHADFTNQTHAPALAGLGCRVVKLDFPRVEFRGNLNSCFAAGMNVACEQPFVLLRPSESRLITRPHSHLKHSTSNGNLFTCSWSRDTSSAGYLWAAVYPGGAASASVSKNDLRLERNICL